MTHRNIPSRIPVIDIGPFDAGDSTARHRIAQEVDRACRRIGFLLIANHGVQRRLVDDAQGVSMEFFARPMEEKDRARPSDAAVPRGYHAFASGNLAKTYGLEAPPDLREQFFIGPLAPGPKRFSNLPQARIFYAENIWPEHPAGFRTVFEDCCRAMEDLAARLMRIFAVALDLPDRYFDDKIDHHFNTCPTNHYPVVDDPEPGQLRAGEHTDFGSLTILSFNDAPGGLQVRMPDDTWFDVKARPGELVVNIGDMMARWTNDRWKSTVHRVVNPPNAGPAVARRQSIGYFLHPNFDTRVECLSTCRDSGNPPRYAPIMAGEHMREKLLRGVESSP
jgi:isopenicillin N synthase-like dioxygenase